MGMTTPQAFYLGNGHKVTSANPAPVWSSLIAMQQHDVSIVAHLLNSSCNRGAVAAEPRSNYLLDEEDPAIYGRYLD